MYKMIVFHSFKEVFEFVGYRTRKEMALRINDLDFWKADFLDKVIKMRIFQAFTLYVTICL